MKIWKILAKHKWVSGATITESVNIKKEGYAGISYRRYTATIRGFQNWKIYEGYLTENTTQRVIDCIKSIRDRIDNDDESVFSIKGYFLSHNNRRAS